VATEIDKIKNDLLALPKESRAVLVRTLIDSLDENCDQNADILWKEEINKRDNQIKAGNIICKSANEVLHRRVL